MNGTMRKALHIFNGLHRKYAGLRPQDRRALNLLLSVVLLAILWKGVWQPVESFRQDSLSAYLSASSDLSWMRAHAAEATPKTADGRAHKKDDRSLLAIASDTSALYNITLSHAEPGANDTLHLSLDTVSYSHLLTWLETLQHEQSVRVMQISIQRLPATPGFVMTDMTLRQ